MIYDYKDNKESQIFTRICIWIFQVSITESQQNAHNLQIKNNSSHHGIVEKIFLPV